MTKEINLGKLFSMKDLPEWVFKTYNCIYLISPLNNITNKSGYVGQAGDFYNRFCLNDRWSHLANLNNMGYGSENYLYNALRKHGCDNFSVKILEENLPNRDLMNERECSLIASYHTFVNDAPMSGYNLTKGGDHRDGWAKAGRKALLEKYPDTNGVSPEATKAWYTSGLRSLKEKYPDTNGIPPQCIKAADDDRKLKYPGTNGVPPENIKKWTKGGQKAVLKKYGSLAHPNFRAKQKEAMDISKKIRLGRYPEHNGVTESFIEAGRKALLEKYPDTNGVSPNAIKSWQKSGTAKAASSARLNCYNSFIKIAEVCKEQGITKLNLVIYNSIRTEFKLKATTWMDSRLKSAFQWFKENNLDISGFSYLFPEHVIS